MKCIIPGQNVKVFGRAVHSLSKIGEELYLEPLEHGLALRTVNSTRSAYGCFVFSPSFFQHYNDGVGSSNCEDDHEESVRCKIGMKTCLTVFRSLSTIEKTVERCEMSLDLKADRLVFQMYCKHGITKTHNLAFIECETLQAVFSKDLCPNLLAAQTRLLCDAVLNFQLNLEEITLVVNPEKVCFKNYIEDEPDPNKLVRTELSLLPEEFERYQVGVDCEVTFCLKELRAILAFSESSNSPISVHFEGSGKPIVFCIDSDPTFEGNFVLATLAPQGVSNSQSFQPSKQVKNTTRNISMDSSHPSTSKVHTSTQMNVESERKRKSISARFEAAYEDLMNDDLDELLTDDLMSLPPGGREQPAHIPRGDMNTLAPSGPLIPVQTGERNKDMFMDADQPSHSLTDDEVPGTPPRKRFKSLFFGLSQSSVTSQKPTADQSLVLAEDTDEEDN